MQYTMGEIIPQTEARGYESNQFATNGEEWILKKILQPGSCVIDVGANVGDWSAIALRIEPQIRLIAFEPVPRLFSLLQPRIGPFSKEVYQMAVSNQVGTESFYTLSEADWDVKEWDWGGSSFYHRQCLPQDCQTLQVPVETLDHYCQNHGISSVDFVKIDVEGNEQRVLQGAEQLLLKHQIKALQFEYGGTFSEVNILLENVLRGLTQKGYLIFRLYYGGMIHIAHWNPAMENGRYSNYLAILPSEVTGFQAMT